MLHLIGARTGSTLRLRDGSEVQEHVFIHACKAKMKDLLQYRIVESAPENIVWQVVPSPGSDREQLSRGLISASRSVLSPEANIRVEFFDRLKPVGMKLSTIVRPSDIDRDLKRRRHSSTSKRLGSTAST